MSVGYTVSRYLYIYALVCEIFFFSLQSGCPTSNLSAYFTFPVNDTGSARQVGYEKNRRCLYLIWA